MAEGVVEGDVYAGVVDDKVGVCGVRGEGGGEGESESEGEGVGEGEMGWGEGEGDMGSK